AKEKASPQGEAREKSGRPRPARRERARKAPGRNWRRRAPPIRLPAEGDGAQGTAGDEVAAERLEVLLVRRVGDVDAELHVIGEAIVRLQVEDLVGGHVADEDAGRPREAVDPAEAGAEVEARRD